MNRKRITAMMLAGMMAASLLTGCGKSNGTAGNGNQTEDTGKTVIKVTKWGDAGIEQELVDAFNESNDLNIEVRLDAIPGDGYGDRQTIGPGMIYMQRHRS